MSRYYRDEEDLDVHIRRGERPVRYVQASQRPRSYYDDAGPSYLVPAPSRSNERSRSRDRRASSPPPPAPVIITNRIYNEHSSDDDDDSDDRHRRSSRSSRHRRRSRSWSRSRSRSSHITREEWEAEQARKDLALMRVSNEREKEQHRLREDWEAERTRKDFEVMRVTSDREKDERRLIKEYQEEEKLKRAKRELDSIKDREARAAEEQRIKKEMELLRLRQDDAAKEEQERRDKEAKNAVERYKQAEKDRIAKEKKAKEDKEKEAKEAVERYKQEERDRILKEKQAQEAKDREYNRRVEEDLRRSGLDDKAIAAVLKKEKIKREEPTPTHQGRPVPLPHHSVDYAHPSNYTQPSSYQQPSNYQQPSQYTRPSNYTQIVPVAPAPPPTTVSRATYTRMARKHLSIETLRTFEVDFDFDEQNPDYVLIKRWVPEWEQDRLWKHTKALREKREKVLMIEEKKNQRIEPEFEWVRKKHDRRRSKSPSLLMYLAGARPS